MGISHLWATLSAPSLHSQIIRLVHDWLIQIDPGNRLASGPLWAVLQCPAMGHSTLRLHWCMALWAKLVIPL